MDNINFIHAEVNPLHPFVLFPKYKGLQAIAIKKNPKLEPKISNLLDPLLRNKPRHIRDALRDHAKDLFPGLLKPFSDKSTIYKQRKRIAENLRHLADTGVDIAEVWKSFCELWNLPEGMKQPRPWNIFSYRYWFQTLRRLIKKATFIYSAIAKPTDTYVSEEYLRYSLELYHDYTLKLINKEGESGLKYSYWQMRKQHMLASSYKVRSEGIASLALNRGLSAYHLTITPLPEYNMHSSAWRGATPGGTSIKLNRAYRKLRDALKYRGYDVDILKFVEFMKSGTPHFHLLLFCNPIHIDIITSIFRKIFIDEGIVGTDGIVIKYVADDEVSNVINYLMKTLWGGLKFQNELENEIQAIGEFGTSRRFSTTSTLHKFPSLELWNKARKGRASLISLYKDKLRKDVKGKRGAVAKADMALNEAARRRDYADFVREFWNATASDEIIKANKIKSVDTASSTAIPQLRLYNQDNLSIRSNGSNVQVKSGINNGMLFKGQGNLALFNTS